MWYYIENFLFAFEKTVFDTCLLLKIWKIVEIEYVEIIEKVENLNAPCFHIPMFSDQGCDTQCTAKVHFW